MLTPADAALASRDPGLPGLAVVLDDDALTALLGARAVRRYVRYKPGTSCLVAAQLDTGDDAVVTAYAEDGRQKADKTSHGCPDAVLAHDTLRRVLAVRPSADRDVPALAALADPRGRRRLLRRLLPEAGADVGTTTLAYKPHRRWVGRADVDGQAVVLRAYPPPAAAAAADIVRRLLPAAPRTPHLLGHDAASGVVALEHVPGRDLARAVRLHCAGDEEVRAAGRALAALHLSGTAGLPPRRPSDDAGAVRAAAAHLAALCPDLGALAVELAEHLVQRLDGLPDLRCTLHGDFSLDQVVLQGSEVALIDLDRAGTGHPAIDLATAAAACAAASPADPPALDVLTALDTGYRQVASLPDPRAVELFTAVALLRRAVEPFRTARPRWREEAEALVRQAGDHAALPVRRGGRRPAAPLDRSPVDLLTPLLGAGVELEVLKDKPGRRRTSRATGPHGSAVVKVYASSRAPVVAARLAALEQGPDEPLLPRVLLCDPERHTVVISEVPGDPFATSVLAGDLRVAERVGRALARWHREHRARPPIGLRQHTAEREGALLLERAAAAPPAIQEAVRARAPELLHPWDCDTVVHRDLYEEQVVVGPLVGLVDLDDAAVGPAELDMGNLAAHLALFGSRHAVATEPVLTALLGAYRGEAPLDDQLFDRCRRLTLLRLACLHADPGLLPPAREDASSRSTAQRGISARRRRR